ncbi:MAG: thymidylate kinase [Planctomycetes bacterium]|nr:thymidylate kinase [Planctomycetota bacterium]
MPMLIDLEGIDGSGKGTQSQRLCERLRGAGYSTALVSFPRYSETLFGQAVGEFLNGQYGALEDVHPFLVSLLFAGDRFESRQYLLDQLARHQVVVLDRYVPSNVAHQASKLEGTERSNLISRILQIEFKIYDMPRPDWVLFLDLPVATAQQLIARKAARQYTDRAADIQEADGAYLERVRAVYEELAATEPQWRRIRCCQGAELRSVEAISEEIWQQVVSVLPA